MNRKILALILGLLSTAGVHAAIDPNAQGKGVEVKEVAIGTDIDNRNLVGKAAEFDATVQKVVCWMMAAADADSTFKHVWYADGEKVAEVPLAVKAPSGRTWSRKNVWPGNWKVEVAGPSGDVLATEEFVVKK